MIQMTRAKALQEGDPTAGQMTYVAEFRKVDADRMVDEREARIDALQDHRCVAHPIVILDASMMRCSPDLVMQFLCDFCFADTPRSITLPSVWGQDFWKTFLFTPDDMTRSIHYVQRNLTRANRPPQGWPFVVSCDDEASDVSSKRR